MEADKKQHVSFEGELAGKDAEIAQLEEQIADMLFFLKTQKAVEDSPLKNDIAVGRSRCKACRLSRALNAGGSNVRHGWRRCILC